MKKGILLIILAAGTLLTSCEGPQGPMGPMGPQGVQGPQGPNGNSFANWKIVDCTVRDLDWQVAPDYYFCEVRINDLTPTVVDFGTVLAYRYLSASIDDPTQQILPYTRHQSDGVNLWTETIDYEFTDNLITFYVTNSDFFYPQEWIPSTMYFRVVLMW